MKKIKIPYLFLILLLTFSVSASSFAQHKEHDSHKEVHWSYKGDTGPEHWGDLKAEYSACKDGKSQSPIDIDKAYTTKLEGIGFAYKPSELKLINNGHTIQFNYAGGSQAKIDGEEFALLQFHFHTPSEHTVKGKHYNMEIHLVHKNKKNELAVVGIFVKEGKANPFLQTIIDNFPSEVNKEKDNPSVKLNASDLLPAKHSYFHYYGSLTTPACTEGVSWNVLKTPVEASKEQIAKFEKLMGENARPVQPLNKRFVLESN